jgi:tetrahydromethanopterin S-methyltransferase subunit E
MLKKIEKYLFILSPVLILVSLFNYYITGRFDLLSITTLAAGLLLGILFFLLYYHEIVMKITKRKIRYGVNSVVISVVVLGLVVITYLVLMDRNKKIDLTQT